MAKDLNFSEATLGNKTILVKNNLEQEQKILDKLTQSYADFAKSKRDIEKKLQDQINDIRKNGTAEEKKHLAELQAEYAAARAARVSADADLENAILNNKKEAADKAALYELNRVKQMTVSQRREYSKQIQETLSEQIRSIETKSAVQKQEELDLDKIIRSRSKRVTKEQKEQAKARKEQLKQEQAQNSASLLKLYDQSSKTFAGQQLTRGEALLRPDARKSARKDIENQSLQQLIKGSRTSTAKLKKLDEEWANKEKARQIEINKLRDKGWNKKAQQLEEEAAAERELWESKRAALEEEVKLTKQNVALKATKVLEDTVEKAFNQLDDNIQAMYGNQAKYTALLQGTDVNWQKSVWGVYSSIGYSGAVSTKDVVKKMGDLLDKGIAYNLELRAFLAETSENIAATFDATNGTLLRLIRLQQSDTTAARLGMEATLTQLFNSFFKDTSYLADNVSESVSAALLEANAAMTKNASLEFEYIVQKWLGALYSIGMSSEGVSQIAQGLGYLGSGNLTAFNSNETLVRLLTMSANQAGGKTIDEMLNYGLTAEDTNRLLRSMVQYLADIANSSDTLVVKSAQAETYGLSITDLNTFSNLKSTEIQSLYSMTEDYESLMEETDTQLRQILKRKNIVQLIDTAMDNALTGVAVTFGSTPGIYGTWKSLNILENLIGDIELPGVQAAGFGMNTFDLLNVSQALLTGFGVAGSLLGALSSAVQGGATNLNAWKYDEYLKRGEGLTLLSSGAATGLSLSAKLGAVSGSGEDIEAITMETAENKGKDQYDKIVSEDLVEEKGVDTNIYEALVDGDENIISVAKDIRSLLSSAGLSAGAPNTGTTSVPGDTSNPVASVPVSSGGSNASASVSSPESSNRIYTLLEKSLTSEDATLISVIQSLADTIDEKLGQERVFYTSIISDAAASSVTASKVSSLSSEVAAKANSLTNQVESNVTSSKPTTGSTSSNTVSYGSGLLQTDEQKEAMQSLISMAVETALRNIAGYSAGDGLPVVVTNLNNYGGV